MNIDSVHSVHDAVVLDVDGLSTSCHQDGRINRAINDVSVQLRQGRVLGVVDDSGCGKSVTASSIMQLLPPLSRVESGSIRYTSGNTSVDIAMLGRNSARMRSIRGSEIGMIFQDPMVSLNPVYTIGWQLVEMIRLHTPLSKSQAREKAVGLLASMGIPSPEQRFDEYPHQFSGGMRQRAMIAMAIACEPNILIA